MTIETRTYPRAGKQPRQVTLPFDISKDAHPTKAGLYIGADGTVRNQSAHISYRKQQHYADRPRPARPARQPMELSAGLPARSTGRDRVRHAPALAPCGFEWASAGDAQDWAESNAVRRYDQALARLREAGADYREGLAITVRLSPLSEIKAETQRIIKLRNDYYATAVDAEHAAQRANVLR